MKKWKNDSFNEKISIFDKKAKKRIKIKISYTSWITFEKWMLKKFNNKRFDIYKKLSCLFSTSCFWLVFKKYFLLSF
jgi:hypothetical protein